MRGEGLRLLFVCGLTDGFGVGEVTKSSGSELVGDQVLSGNHMNGSPVDLRLDTIRPGLVEGHAIDLLKDVDAQGRLANLEDGGGIIAEVLGADAGQRRSISGKSSIDNDAVRRIGTYKDVEIFRRSRLGVNADRVAADKKIFNPVCVECE